MWSVAEMLGDLSESCYKVLLIKIHHRKNAYS